MRLLEATGIIVVTACLMELALRAFPSVIPPSLLIQFHPKVRAEAAKGRFLIYHETERFERDDGGPPLRIVKPFTTLRWHNTDEPGDVFVAKVDEMGFCNVPGIYKGRSRSDVVTVGDSFTWCNSVSPEETWTAQLSALAGRSTYNLGRGGAGVYEYLQILKGFGVRKKPRLVMLAVYEGTDLRDALRYYSYRAYRSDYRSRSRKGGVVERHSYLFNLVRSVAKNIPSEKRGS